MKNNIYIAAAAAVLLVPIALFLRTFSPSPLPIPKPYAGPLPPATPPKEIAVYSLVAGVNHRVATSGPAIRSWSTNPDSKVVKSAYVEVKSI